MQIDLKMSDLLYYRQSVFIVFILLATYQLPVLLVKPSSGVEKFPLIFWKLPLLSFIECIPYLAEPSSRVSKVASIFWQLPYCRGTRVKSLSIASMKDIDCKILVTANFTVYLQFSKLCQNDQVISFGTNRKVFENDFCTESLKFLLKRFVLDNGIYLWQRNISSNFNNAIVCIY